MDMSRFRPWAFWRRLQYGVGAGAFVTLSAVLVYFIYFTTPPSCFDGLQNGDETGVDCGGSCVRICAAEVMQPAVVWADSFRVTEGQYNAVAYIENRNQEAATKELKYTLILRDDESIIAERSGTTVLPPNSVYPVFEGPIYTEGGRVPTETEMKLEPVEVWQPATVGRDQFRVLDYTITSVDSRPRVTAKIENTALTDADEVEVVATIMGPTGEPLTSSRTYIDRFTARSTREVVFTWPNSIARTVRSCEIPSDIMMVLDRSGSMTADGKEPPEPLTSTKRAAETFVNQVRKEAKVGVLSYATTPSLPLEQTLTNDLTAARTAIASITMGTDGVQYTNMGDAIKAAYEELLSERHRDNARKVIILMSDGDVTMPFNPETGEIDRAYAAAYAERQAAAAKANETTIYTIGFGDFLRNPGPDLTRDTALLRGLSSGAGYYFEAPTITELSQVYQTIASGLCEEGEVRIEIIPKTAANFTPLQ